MKLVKEKVNIFKIVDNVAKDMKPSILEKNLKLKVDINKTPSWIKADEKRISQVVRNLINNAVKCTNKGSITISAKKQKNKVVVSIKDTGIGILKKDMPKLFGKFSQLDSGEARKVEGTGLGLYICKGILKQHKGDISS